MELSYFLGQLLGSTLVLFAVAGLVRPAIITNAIRDFDHDAFTSLSWGITAISAGVALVLTHNIWDGSWRVLVTVIGWGAVIKGFIYLIAPQQLIGLGRWVYQNAQWTRAVLTVLLIMGAYLAYKGFGY